MSPLRRTGRRPTQHCAVPSVSTPLPPAAAALRRVLRSLPCTHAAPLQLRTHREPAHGLLGSPPSTQRPPRHPALKRAASAAVTPDLCPIRSGELLSSARAPPLCCGRHIVPRQSPGARPKCCPSLGPQSSAHCSEPYTS